MLERGLKAQNKAQSNLAWMLTLNIMISHNRNMIFWRSAGMTHRLVEGKQAAEDKSRKEPFVHWGK